jgi:20S proteasome subunit beta 5
MDTLVARYSRPMFSNEGYAKEQQEELEAVQEVPALSLKFAMPPVAQVRLHLSCPAALPPVSVSC